MENWGLTTYRETSLLYDPEVSSTSDKLWVTLVIGHELAHQVSTAHVTQLTWIVMIRKGLKMLLVPLLFRFYQDKILFWDIRAVFLLPIQTFQILTV